VIVNVISYKINTAGVTNLVKKIPKFSEQDEEIQLEEFVQKIHYKDRQNEEICVLFRRKLEGKADHVWRFLEEEKINLNIWKNFKCQFQEYFPTKMKTPIAKKIQKVHPRTKVFQMPRVIQGAKNLFADRCRDEAERIMKKVPSPEDSHMPAAHSELSEEDKVKSKELT